MNRLRAMTIGGALLAALILGVFAYLIADAQSQDREDVEKRFRDVAQVSGAVTNGIFQSASSRRRGRRRPRSSRARSTSGRSLSSPQQGQAQYVVVYDAERDAAGRHARRPAPGPAVDTARKTGSRGSRTSWAPARTPRSSSRSPSTRRRAADLRHRVAHEPFADFLAASLGQLPRIRRRRRR